MTARKLLIWSGAVVGALALAWGVVAMSTGLVHSSGKASALVATGTSRAPTATTTHSPSASPRISVSPSPSTSPIPSETKAAGPAPAPPPAETVPAAPAPAPASVETVPAAPVETTPAAPAETTPPAPVTSAIIDAVATMLQAGQDGKLPYVVTAEVRLAPEATLRCWVVVAGTVFESNEMVLESWIGDRHPLTAIGEVILEPADYPFTAYCATSDGVTWSQGGTAYHDEFVAKKPK